MIWGLLYLIAVLTGGGTESPYLNPDIEKVLKEVIEDVDRRKEALVLAKEYKAEWKAYNKKRKKALKSGKSFNKERVADHEALAGAFKQTREQRRAVHQKAIEVRLKIQQLTTSEEWARGIDRILTVKEKDAKKLSKAEAKSKIEQDKLFDGLSKQLEKYFSDPSQLEKARNALQDYENDLVSWIMDFQSFTYRDVEILQRQDASRQQLEDEVDQLNGYREKMDNSFLNFRNELVELSTEENWPGIAKALAKFY
jgi:hypothetical protein